MSPTLAHGVVLLVEEARTRPASVPLGRTATWSVAPGCRTAHACSVPRCWAATPWPRAWGLGGLGRGGQADSCRRWSPGVGGPAYARETTGFWKGPVSVEREWGTCALPCPVQTIGAVAGQLHLAGEATRVLVRPPLVPFPDPFPTALSCVPALSPREDPSERVQGRMWAGALPGPWCASGLFRAVSGTLSFLPGAGALSTSVLCPQQLAPPPPGDRVSRVCVCR